ncbi:hypothetical protein RGQ29_027206 [Quercus rubra]|uniref:Uncharacterized protein n=1 Tax=Quercus rubra TaxID=3512 RepID=A0AAN7EPQ8_QUERU|nr:hypothetical protein RGQ29_027206 [Quercus rubra]
MAAWTGAARHAVNLARLSSPKTPSTAQAASLIHRRGISHSFLFAFFSPCLVAEKKKIKEYHHGPPKVNFWQDPLSPSKWKEEHFVIASLTGWGLLFYGGYKFFTKGKNSKKEEVGEPSH